MATTAATPTATGPPAASAAPASPRRPNVAAPPTSAPAAKVAQASSDVRRRPAYPLGARVSTIDRPHGDHAPDTPAAAAAASRQAVSIAALRRSAQRLPRARSSPYRRPGGRRSARHGGLEVHDAEHLPVLVAVALERGVAVDARAAVGAAVDQLAHVPGARLRPLDRPRAQPGGRRELRRLHDRRGQGGKRPVDTPRHRAGASAR